MPRNFGFRKRILGITHRLGEVAASLPCPRAFGMTLLSMAVIKGDEYRWHHVGLNTPIVPFLFLTGASVLSARRFEEKSFADVYSEFSQAKDDLDQLINIVNASAGWWNDIETQLKSLQLSLSTLDRPNPLRIKGIERRWSDIRLKFLTYSLRVRIRCLGSLFSLELSLVQVALIQDLCPTVGQGSQIEAPPGRVTSQESSSVSIFFVLWLSSLKVLFLSIEQCVVIT